MEAKAAAILTKKLVQMKDFQPPAHSLSASEEYAKKIAKVILEDSADKEEFKDKLLSILSNLDNLEGELSGGKVLQAEVVARMDPAEMLSAKQQREAAVQLRKRLRESQTYDKTSMNCERCGLVRRDRLNINTMGLDSEENGTQYDYNFGNLCECEERSASDVEEEEEELVVEKVTTPKKRKTE